MSKQTPLLNGHVAVVTGGASGIGRGIALGLADHGADVAIVDIDGDSAAKTCEAIETLGARGFAVTCDVMDRQALRDALHAVGRTLGPVSILVNNAGGVRPGPFIDQSDRSMDRQLALNCTSVLIATQTVARGMIEAGLHGSIINVASIEGVRAAPHFAVYAAAKAAVISFTRTMALELAEHGIRVNCIAPDFVATDGVRSINPGIDGEVQTRARKRYIPMGRDGTPEDIAQAAVYLCSPLAAYVTGTVHHVDGGTWASSGWLRDGAGGWEVMPGMNRAIRPI